MTIDKFTFNPVHDDIKTHAASGFVFTGGTQVIKILIQFISVVIMARLLEPADFGLVAMVTPIYNFIILFHDLGLSQATMRNPQITSEQVNSFFWINIGVGITLCLLLILFSPLVGWFYGDSRTINLTIAMALLLFLGSLGNQHGAIINRKMQFRDQAIINTVSAIIALIGAVAWGYVFGGYWALYVGMALGTIFPVIGVWIFVKWRPSWPALADEMSIMLKYGLGVTGANLTNFVVQSANNIVAGRVLGSRPLGLYDRASRILYLPLQQVIAPISSVIFPILCRLHGDDDRYRRTFLRMLGSITLVISPGVIWAIVMGSLLVPIVLGSKWDEATPLFTILSFAALTQLINSSVCLLFVTQDRTGELARWSLFSGAVSLIGLAMGLPFGIVGVAAASVVSQLIRTPLLWWYACRTGPVKLGNVLHAIIPQSVGCGIAFFALEMLRYSWITSEWLMLTTGLILSYAIAGLVVAAFPAGREAIMLYAFKSDTLSHVWKLWAKSVASFALCFVGKSLMQPSIAAWNFLKS